MLVKEKPAGGNPAGGAKERDKSNQVHLHYNLDSAKIQSPDFKLIRIKNDPTMLKLGPVWTNGDGLLFVRTTRLEKPIGGKLGTIITCNPKTGRLSAKFADWQEWVKLRDGLTRLKNVDFIEIAVDVLQAALKVQ